MALKLSQNLFAPPRRGFTNVPRSLLTKSVYNVIAEPTGRAARSSCTVGANGKRPPSALDYESLAEFEEGRMRETASPNTRCLYLLFNAARTWSTGGIDQP